MRLADTEVPEWGKRWWGEQEQEQEQERRMLDSGPAREGSSHAATHP